jgi:hypothetical protein
MLVQCAQYIWEPSGQDSDLGRWGLQVIEGGKGVSGLSSEPVGFDRRFVPPHQKEGPEA